MWGRLRLRALKKRRMKSELWNFPIPEEASNDEVITEKQTSVKMATEPDEITVIVVAGKGLQGKKPGRHKFSVIFGVGNRKYRTCVVKDPNGCPEWNEESVIQVNNLLDQAFFIVTEKEDIIGQINIPVSSLQGPPGRQIKGPLQPHKKCPNPKGELIYQCFVSKFRPSLFPHASTPKRNTQNVYDKHRNGTPTSPILRNKHEKKRNSAFQTLNKKFSKSIHDLFSFARSSPTHEEDENKNLSNLRSNARSNSISSGLDNSDKTPLITSVTPIEGPIDGGTRVRIEGKNLGLSKADIMELLICECDHADYVEFESSTRIFVKTKPSLAGRGDIILETESGGIGTLKNCFTYIDPSAPSTPSISIDDTDSNNTRFSIGEEDIKQTPPVPSSPKVKTLSVTLPHAGSTDNLESKTKNHFLKHIRRSSEGTALIKTKGPVQAIPPVNMEDLKEEIARLKKENEQIDLLKEEIAVLKNDKKDMQAYIDKLVTKVITHCPEALASDELKFG